MAIDALNADKEFQKVSATAAKAAEKAAEAHEKATARVLASNARRLASEESAVARLATLGAGYAGGILRCSPHAARFRQDWERR